MLNKFNNKFTHAALSLDEKINACSLFNIPEKPWIIFTRLIYGHFFLATTLFIVGTLCFCLGLQYSIMYNEVNCTNGINIWIPLLNLIVSLSGLFMLRTLQLHWPAFIYCLGLWIMVIMMLVTITDNIFASLRWFNVARKPIDQWAAIFSWTDLILAILAILNEISYVFILVSFVKYWYQSSSVTNN
ncbi:putative integral membrane protein [Acanthocheilonema viteae]